PKKRLKKSSPKYSLKGDRPKLLPWLLPLNIFVVLILTTAGLTRSARSEKEPGTVASIAAAAGISGAPEGIREDLRTSTRETIKKATKNAIKNIKKVLRFLFSISSSTTLIKNYCYKLLNNFKYYNNGFIFVNEILFDFGNLKFCC